MSQAKKVLINIETGILKNHHQKSMEIGQTKGKRELLEAIDYKVKFNKCVWMCSCSVQCQMAQSRFGCVVSIKHSLKSFPYRIRITSNSHEYFPCESHHKNDRKHAWRTIRSSSLSYIYLMTEFQQTSLIAALESCLKTGVNDIEYRLQNVVYIANLALMQTSPVGPVSVIE